LPFSAIALNNILHDIGTHIIDTDHDVYAAISRAFLYVIFSIVFCWTLNISSLSVAVISYSIGAGCLGKITLSILFTQSLLGVSPGRNSVIEFPNQYSVPANWIGYYCILLSVLSLIIVQQYSSETKDPNVAKSFPLFSAYTLYSSYVAIYASIVLGNLSSSIALLVLCLSYCHFILNVVIRKKFSFSSRILTLNTLRFLAALIIFIGVSFYQYLNAPISGSLVMAGNPVSRVHEIINRNDRAELNYNAARRFILHKPSPLYLVSGPKSFQRPICFHSVSETIFQQKSSCHDYWHSFPWDSFKNFGYIGLFLASFSLLTLISHTLVNIIKNRLLNAAAGFLLLYILLTSPIVEIGSGLILPIIAITCLLLKERSINYDGIISQSANI